MPREFHAEICQVYAKMLKYCIEKKAKIHVEDLLRSLHGMQPGNITWNFKQVREQFFNSSAVYFMWNTY